MKRVVIALALFVIAGVGAYLWRSRAQSDERFARAGRVVVTQQRDKPLELRDYDGGFRVQLTRSSRALDFGVRERTNSLLVVEAPSGVHSLIVLIEPRVADTDKAFEASVAALVKRTGVEMTSDSPTTIANHPARVTDYVHTNNGHRYVGRHIQLDIAEHGAWLMVDALVLADAEPVDRAWLDQVSADLATIDVTAK
jgi:hypothetical protein